jgi:hypothetical protein
MIRRKLDRWAWLMIYSGLLALSLGWFMLARDAALGSTLMAAGGLVAAIGVGLILVRSRMGP